MLNAYRRPLPGSPAIPRRAGAFTPAGDWNGDWKLDDYDEGIMISKMTGQGREAPLEDRTVFDFDGDGDIDANDYNWFLQGAVLDSQDIPAVSTWGMTALGLGVLTAGTLKLRNLNKRGKKR